SGTGPFPDRLAELLSLAQRSAGAESAITRAPQDDPDLIRAVGRQRRVAVLLQSGGPATPASLHARIDAVQKRGRPRRLHIPSLRPLTVTRARWAAGLATVGAAAVALVALVATGSS